MSRKPNNAITDLLPEPLAPGGAPPSTLPDPLGGYDMKSAKVAADIKQMVLPYLQMARCKAVDDAQTLLLDIVEENLHQLALPCSDDLSGIHLRLSPTEMQVAGLVRDGRTTAQIARTLKISAKTVAIHRSNIRKKLGLRNTKKNLRAFLLAGGVVLS